MNYEPIKPHSADPASVQPTSAQPDVGHARDFAERADVALICEVRQGIAPWKMARLDDISQAGFRIALLPNTKRDVPLRIRIPGLQMLSANIRWQRDKAIGCEFTEPLHVAVFEHIVRQCRFDQRG